MQAQQVIVQAASDPTWRWVIVGVVVPLVAVLATWWRR